MENENMIPEEETSILTLTDENGQDIDFEYLDCLEYQGKEYLILMPAEEESAEIVILEIQPVDEENENYLAVEDEEVLDAVYEIFKEKFKDVLTFEEQARTSCGNFRSRFFLSLPAKTRKKPAFAVIDRIRFIC